jgi:phospholipase/carboxylesterase
MADTFAKQKSLYVIHVISAPIVTTTINFEPLPEGYAFDAREDSIKHRLVVLLHGYGSCGFDLINLVPYLREEVRGCYWYAPNGLEARNSFGYQWFDYESDISLSKHMQGAKPAIESMLHEKTKSLNMKAADVCLIGFSQGGMVALDLASSNSLWCAVSFSGALISKPKASSTPLCLIHGEQDEVVPFKEMQRSKSELEDAGCNVSSLALEGLGHSIDLRGLQFASKFIVKAMR